MLFLKWGSEWLKGVCFFSRVVHFFENLKKSNVAPKKYRHRHRKRARGGLVGISIFQDFAQLAGRNFAPKASKDFL